MTSDFMQITDRYHNLISNQREMGVENEDYHMIGGAMDYRSILSMDKTSTSRGVSHEC